MTLHALPAGDVALLASSGRIEHAELGSLVHRRSRLVRDYLAGLDVNRLLRNHVLETGAFGWGAPAPGTAYGGWEAPDSQLRGHFVGHWLSAAARFAAGGDDELRLRARQVVSGLARCQAENDGEWVFSIPEKYLHRIAAGKPVWAPQYTVHKTLMGLLDAHRYLDDEESLSVATNAAAWFHRWTGGFTRDRLDDLLDVETGGMLEVWADLYAVTGDPRHAELVERYDRRRLFDPLLAGEDPLTNRHANTTIPEVLGAARAYEVTGEQRWRDVVHAYWRCAVEDRDAFATGGQTSYEVWTPPGELATRLGKRTQEHCSVYNLMRLADVLLRWTGEPRYADYLERNLWNGILAQQHDRTGMVAYYLPLHPGARKHWGTPTETFWCCHGSLAQAHAAHDGYLWYADDRGVTVAQYVPSTARLTVGGTGVDLRQVLDPELGTHIAAAGPRGAAHRPDRTVVEVTVTPDHPAELDLRLRIPDWTTSGARVLVDGVPEPVAPGTFHTLRRSWRGQTVRLELPRPLRTVALPDRPDTVAFLDGPVVLAALSDDERELSGDAAGILFPDDVRDPYTWNRRYRTRGQRENLAFVPLHEITDQPYTVYHPLT